tara:strand:+ start:4946 stop:6172 length:1227 start_codon:yes stop_codon:yes gene_type:complete
MIYPKNSIELSVRTIRPIILCFVAYYLPGFRSGGPVRTIANFVDHLGDEFDIRIVTSHHDFLETRPYAGVLIDDWNSVGKARVFYASPKSLSLLGIIKLLSSTDYDILYLNSFFSITFTALPLFVRKIIPGHAKPCVIAPRGEFSSAATSLKPFKKQLYLIFSRFFRLYSSLIWQASSQFECSDIRRVMGLLPHSIHVAPDLPPSKFFRKPYIPRLSAQCERASLCLIFLSRIVPMKNLDFLLQVLCHATFNVELRIYGPVEDLTYWKHCQALISLLPPNVTVECMGPVEPHLVSEVLSLSDLFVLPTRGENFGHVVLEALSVGTPVLISDRTPWLPSSDSSVQVLPLDDPFVWVSALEQWASFDSHQRLSLRHAAFDYAQIHLHNSNVIERNRNLFQSSLSQPLDVL